MQARRVPSQRTESMPAQGRDFMHGELRDSIGETPGQELRFAGPDSGAVELGLQSAKQSSFVGERGRFTTANVKINPGDFAHHAQASPRYSLRVRHTIAPQSISQVLRFADIDNFAAGVAHGINAGPCGNFAK